MQITGMRDKEGATALMRDVSGKQVQSWACLSCSWESCQALEAPRGCLGWSACRRLRR